MKNEKAPLARGSFYNHFSQSIAEKTRTVMTPHQIRFIAAESARYASDIVLALTGQTVQADGRGWKIRNPRREDRHPSLHIFPDGGFKDFASGDSGRDVVALVAYLRDCTMSQGARWISAFLSLSDSGVVLPGIPGPILQRNTSVILEPVPVEAMAKLQFFVRWARRRLHATGAYWIIRDILGRPLGIRIRCEPPGEKKFVLPVHWDRQRAQWRPGGSFPVFYGLEILRIFLDAHVLIVEGEKTCDAARSIFSGFAVLGLMGSGAQRKVDLSPLLGRKTIIWPDADSIGMEAARTLAARLYGQGNQVSIVELPESIKAWIKPGNNKPGGWDLADAVPDGVDLYSVLKDARFWGAER